MGGWFSSEAAETKAVDNNGEVINTLIVNPDQPILFICAVFLSVAKLFEIIIFIYKEHKRSLKKRYQAPASV